MTSSPESWSVTPLGELVEVLDFARIPVSAPERAKRLGSVPYYGAAGQVGWIDKPLFDEPLVLLGEDGVQFFDSMKSKAYAISGPAWVNNHAHVLRARPAMDRRYLLHFLNQFDYRGFANGTTRLKLTQAAMRRMPISYPELDEQRRIVDILEDRLSRLDAALTNLGMARSRSEGLLISAVLGNVHVKTAPTQPLVGLLAEPLANGRSVPTLEGGFPVLRLTALKADGIDLTERKGGSWTEADARRFLVRRGDFLVSRGNGSLRLVARGAHVIDDPDPVAYPDTIIRIRMRPAEIVPEYMHLVWNSPIVRRQIESMARTTAGIHKVNQKHLESVRIPVPRMEQQREVSEQVGQISAAANRLQDELRSATEHAERLRRALLAAAFSGCLTNRRSSDMEMVEEMAGV